jgi:uncharacterized protein
MRLTNDIELLDGLPIIYIKSLSAIACSDLHLGYEGVMADKGTFLPKVNLRKIKESLKKAVEATGAERIIVDGDIKNEFSDVHVEEFNEFYDLTNYIKRELKIKTVTLIKGNHDNFIERLKEPFKFEIYAQEAMLGKYLFFHGEELPRDEGKFMIMGHVHPAIAVYNKLGVKEKLRCFLYGKMKDGKEVIVLPAMNYFAEGVSVNLEDVSEMAPAFQDMLNVDRMHAYCIGEGETLDFGTIKNLRKIALE